MSTLKYTAACVELTPQLDLLLVRQRSLRQRQQLLAPQLDLLLVRRRGLRQRVPLLLKKLYTTERS